MNDRWNSDLEVIEVHELKPGETFAISDGPGGLWRMRQRDKPGHVWQLILGPDQTGALNAGPAGGTVEVWATRVRTSLAY